MSLLLFGKKVVISSSMHLAKTPQIYLEFGQFFAKYSLWQLEIPIPVK
jgi:hypothetical protein